MDETVWSLPGEVRDLAAASESGSILLTWVAPTIEGAESVVYDTLRTDRPDGFEPGSGADVLSIDPNGSDTSTIDGEVPADGFYYLVRAGNACGEGSIGCQRDPVGPCP